MLFLIAIVVAVLFSWFCAEPIRKNPVPFYLVGTVITVFMIVIGQTRLQVPAFVNTYIIGLFNQGALAAALWYVVAFIGALPDGAKDIRKRLLPSRGELSIFAALITISHAVKFGISYIQRLTSGRPATTDFILTCIICLALMLIMIPLTVISFKAVRKKFKGKTWKNIQKAAYVFYALIYLHVMVIYILRAKQGRDGAMLSVLVYTVFFAVYAAFRIRKEIIKKKNPENKAALNAVCTAAVLVITGALGIASRASAAPEEPVRTAENAVSTSAPAETQGLTEAVSQMETSAETDASAETETAAESLADETEETAENSEISEDTENIETSETAQAETISETAASEKTTEKTSETTAEKINETAAPETAQATEAAAEQPEADETTPVQEEQPSENTPEENPAPVQEEQPQPVEEEPQTEPVTEPEPETEPETEPPANTIYNDGVYSAEEFGYDSTVYITVTIQNDVITDITATCDESDMWYFEEAYPVIKGRMLAAQSANVDGVSGSTYSSDALMKGVQKALDAQENNLLSKKVQ